MTTYTRGKCFRCRGFGTIAGGKCWKCGGKGYVLLPAPSEATKSAAERMIGELQAAGVEVTAMDGGVVIQGYEVMRTEFEALAEASDSVNDFLERLAVMRQRFE